MREMFIVIGMIKMRLGDKLREIKVPRKSCKAQTTLLLSPDAD